MNVAVLGESPADEAAIRILTDAVLGSPTSPVSGASIRSRGWPSVRDQLPLIIRSLHYGTDADALVVVVDSNSTPVSELNDQNIRVAHSDSRLVELQSICSRTLEDIGPRPHRAQLRIALGVAVPAIEAWYQCGIDPHAYEAAWEGATYDKRRQLKRDIYGTVAPSRPLEEERALGHAKRLAAELELLESHFPIGFGSLAAQLRSWRAARTRDSTRT